MHLHASSERRRRRLERRNAGRGRTSRRSYGSYECRSAPANNYRRYDDADYEDDYDDYEDTYESDDYGYYEEDYEEEDYREAVHASRQRKRDTSSYRTISLGNELLGDHFEEQLGNEVKKIIENIDLILALFYHSLSGGRRALTTSFSFFPNLIHRLLKLFHILSRAAFFAAVPPCSIWIIKQIHLPRRTLIDQLRCVSSTADRASIPRSLKRLRGILIQSTVRTGVGSASCLWCETL